MFSMNFLLEGEKEKGADTCSGGASDVFFAL